MLSRTLTASMMLVLGLALWAPAGATTPLTEPDRCYGPMSADGYGAMAEAAHHVADWLHACPVGTSGAQLGGAVPSPLQQLVSRIRTVAPYAQVTSTFDEWRGPGGLRPHGGHHNGYDIGLDAGTPVPAAWDGRVVKIEPWGGTENCIIVQTGAICTGYGHLSPAVAVGQWVRAGDIVGQVCYNHVDVKMRSGDCFVDYGRADPFNDPKAAALAGRPIGNEGAVE